MLVQEEEGLVAGARGRCRRGTEREGTKLQLGEKAPKGLRGDGCGEAVWRAQARMHGRREGGEEVLSVQKGRGRVKQKQLLSRKRFEPRGKQRSKSEAWHRGERRDE